MDGSAAVETITLADPPTNSGGNAGGGSGGGGSMPLLILAALSLTALRGRRAPRY